MWCGGALSFFCVFSVFVFPEAELWVQLEIWLGLPQLAPHGPSLKCRSRISQSGQVASFQISHGGVVQVACALNPTSTEGSTR